MARKNFLYYFFSKNVQPLYQDQNDLAIKEGDATTWLRPNGQPAKLNSDPAEARGTLVKYARNIKNWGVFRDMTIPMKFVKDAAAILMNRMHTFGYEAEVQMVILKLNRIILPYLYEHWYDSELNFTKYKEVATGVQIEALEGGVSKYLKAFENTEYEIPLDEYQVKNDGILLSGQLSYETFVDSGVPGQHYVPVAPTGFEGTKIDIVQTDGAIVADAVLGGYEATSTAWIASADKDINPIRIVGSIKLYLGDSIVLTNEANHVYNLRLRTSTNRTLLLVTTIVPDILIEHEYFFDISWNLLAGENVFLEGEWTGPFVVVYLPSTFRIEFKNKFKDTYTWCNSAQRMGEKLLEKMTDGRYKFKSAWLKNRTDISYTSGNALRRFSDPTIKISFSDFFKSLQQFGAGYGIENNQLAVEKFEYFFKDQVILTLGEVDAAELIVAEDLLYNTVSAGMKQVTYEDTNGLYETNQTAKWTLPVTKPQAKDFDLVTPVRTDPYGIEFVRQNLDGLTTTDASSDNDSFMQNTESVLQPADPLNGIPAHYKLNRPAFTTLTGVPDPDGIFNMLWTPAQSLLNNGAYLHSILDKRDAEQVIFQTQEKNKELVFVLNGVQLIQKANINVGNLPAKLFLPHYVNFKTKANIKLLEIMENNPYGLISFIWNKRTWYAFLMDGGLQPATLDIQTWKVLMAASNIDLINFNKHA